MNDRLRIDDEADYDVIELHADHGTIVQFRALDADGTECLVCADHRPAQAILAALEAGEDVTISAPGWAVSY